MPAASHTRSVDTLLETRRCLRELTESLMVEYAGALPPGQVIATVTRASKLVSRSGPFAPRRHVDMCADLVRNMLTERICRESTTA